MSARGFITIREIDGKPEIVGLVDTGDPVVLRSPEDAQTYAAGFGEGVAACSSSIDFPEEYGLTTEYVAQVLAE